MLTTRPITAAATTLKTIKTRRTTTTTTRDHRSSMMTTRIMNTSAGGRIASGEMLATSAKATTSTMITTKTATVGATATTATATTIKTKTTITSDPGILCFHHCNVKVFCFTLPHICPQCKTALATTHKSSGGGAGTNKPRRTKKRTIANKAESTATKGHHLTNGDDNDDNKRDDNDVQDIAVMPDSHQHQLVKDEQEEVNDENVDEDEDDDEDADTDDDSNENGLVSHIMASRLLPFRLPYPFVRANQYPCAIVLRPTTGDFLNDYNNTTDLHIAVTTSTGCVVEFDRHGLRRHRTDNMSDWWQCLLVGDVPEPWYDYWDQVLLEICQQADKWTVSHYHEDKHNCYTFVLTFLQALTYDKLSEAATSKTTFCEKYIVPRTTTAGKYISLYRKLRDAGIYVHHTNHNKLRHALHAGKAGKQQPQHHHQQQQQQHHPHQQHQQQANKLSNSAVTVATRSLISSHKQEQQQNPEQRYHHQQQQKQQQHQQLQQPKQHHHQQHSNNHHSIISRPHSTLCTIEE